MRHPASADESREPLDMGAPGDPLDSARGSQDAPEHPRNPEVDEGDFEIRDDLADQDPRRRDAPLADDADQQLAEVGGEGGEGFDGHGRDFSIERLTGRRTYTSIGCNGGIKP